MSSVFSASVVCILLLFLLAPETLGNKQIKFFQDSIGRRARVAKTTKSGVRELIRRDTCDDYNRRIAVLECDAAYIEAVRKDEDTTCGNLFGASISATDCGTYNGTLCSVFDNDYSLQQTEFRNTLSSCFDLSDGIYRLPSQCRNECTLALRELSDRIGCCLYNIDYITILRTPSLWMNCDVERPTPCADSPEFPNQDDILSAPCSYRYYADQYYYTYCKYLGEELSKINMECGRSEQDTLERCGYDKGKYCGYLNDQDQTLLPIYDKCISFFGESTSDRNCNDECKSAIQDLKDTYGCCVITFNTTYTDNYDITASQVLRSDLWASCGIEIPQNCIASSLDAMRPPEVSPCGARGSTAVPVLIYSTLLIVIGLAIAS